MAGIQVFLSEISDGYILNRKDHAYDKLEETQLLLAENPCVKEIYDKRE